MPKNCFSRKTGIISKGEDLFERELINLMISSTLGVEKMRDLIGHCQLRKADGED